MQHHTRGMSMIEQLTENYRGILEGLGLSLIHI